MSEERPKFLNIKPIAATSQKNNSTPMPQVIVG
jgi:hypothetical protein